MIELGILVISTDWYPDVLSLVVDIIISIVGSFSINFAITGYIFLLVNVPLNISGNGIITERSWFNVIFESESITFTEGVFFRLINEFDIFSWASAIYIFWIVISSNLFVTVKITGLPIPDNLNVLFPILIKIPIFFQVTPLSILNSKLEPPLELLPRNILIPSISTIEPGTNDGTIKMIGLELGSWVISRDWYPDVLIVVVDIIIGIDGSFVNNFSITGYIILLLNVSFNILGNGIVTEVTWSNVIFTIESITVADGVFIPEVELIKLVNKFDISSWVSVIFWFNIISDGVFNV